VKRIIKWFKSNSANLFINRVKSIPSRIFNEFLIYLSTRISSLLFRLQPEVNCNRGINDFLPLTPSLLSKADIQEYEVQLTRALKGQTCKQITNIAITGSYAVGKSSFIRTFIHHNAEYQRTPIISMAKFSAQNRESDIETGNSNSSEQYVNDNKVTEIKKSFLEQIEIEKSILEQLIYSADPETLKLSRFKRLREPSKLFVLYILMLMASFMSFFPTIREKITPLAPLLDGQPIDIRWFSFSYIVLFVVFMLKPLINIVRGYSMTKFSFHGMDFERQHSRSFLRENVDEFIYFFDKTKVQLVVFEDIDRLDPSQAMAILTHIREVNRLVNLNRTVPIFFIYAVKDDLFRAEERTKFFDLIIPIIPVINSNNAYEMLSKALGLEAANDTNKGSLSKQLVRDVSLFFGDLRLIYSLANEYKIYKSKLSKIHQIDLNKLFSLLVVKTMHPSVYTQLLVNQGVINEVVNKSVEAKKALMSDIIDKKRQLTEQVSNQKKLHTDNRHELLALYWAIFSKSANVSNFPTSIRIGANTYNIINALEPDSEFEKFMLGERGDEAEMYYQVQYQSYSLGYIRHPLKILNSKGFNYKKCIELLDLNIPAIENELAELIKKINEINDQSIEDLVKNPTARQILLSPLNEGYNVIKYLFSHGYIVEDYADYTSFFYPGTITQSDKVKVQQIKLLNRLPTDTKFDKPEEVLEQLQPRDLADGRGLISSLLPELLQTKNKTKLQSALSNTSTFDADLVALWMGLTEQELRKKLLNSLLEMDSKAVITILSLLDTSPEHAESQKKQFIIEVLSNPQNSSQSKLESCEMFCKSVSMLKDLDGFEVIKGDWFWSSDKIKYCRLETVPENLARRIIESGQFEINETTLFSLLNHANLGGGHSILSYQSVLDTKCRSFIQIIDDQISAFLGLVKNSKEWKESNDSAVQLLLKADVLEYDKLVVAKSVGGLFQGEVIPDNCLLTFIRHNLLEVNLDEVWDAQMRFETMQDVEHGETSEAISEFVERHITILTDDKNNNHLDESYRKYLLELNLSDATFRNFVRTITLSIEFLSELDLTNERWILLVNTASLTFSEEIFFVIQNESVQAAAMFLLKDWASSYNQLRKDIEILNDTALFIMNSKNICVEEKIIFLKYKDDIDFSANKPLAEDIVEDALANKLALPPIASSLVEQIRQSVKTELRARVALYYISNSDGSFSETCKILALFKVPNLEDLSSKPKLLTVEDNKTYSTLMNKLNALGFIGAIKSESKGRLTGHLRPSMCTIQ